MKITQLMKQKSLYLDPKAMLSFHSLERILLREFLCLSFQKILMNQLIRTTCWHLMSEEIQIRPTLASSRIRYKRISNHLKTSIQTLAKMAIYRNSLRVQAALFQIIQAISIHEKQILNIGPDLNKIKIPNKHN